MAAKIPRRKKKMMFEELKDVSETGQYGRPEISVQIFEWMEKKKMKFTPSQPATFVDFIDRVHSIRAALDYFESVDPDFNNMDYMKVYHI
ncbi:hypothetical protein F2Q68_00041561 [Brassica cretica]|uniref:Uncharacterized protein n=1 Tax=Brassica cretica TaxID=69181 RepID=A0A8S9MJ93_BRACR|nr:hypothetical protein F2Q68_00041561 [Brassica cretica]